MVITTTHRSKAWALSILIVCLLAAWGPVTGQAPIRASQPSIVLHLGASAACDCLATFLVPNVDTYSEEGSVCISLIANPETPVNGVCNEPTTVCEGVEAKKCQIVWNFTLQVGNTPNPPCNFGARLFGASAPSALLQIGGSEEYSWWVHERSA